MEDTENSNGNQKCHPKTRTLRGGTRANPQNHHHHHQLIHHANQFGFCNQNQYYQRYSSSYPDLLPLPPLLPLQLALTPPLPPNHHFRSKTHLQKPSCRLNTPPFAASSETQVPQLTISPIHVEAMSRQQIQQGSHAGSYTRTAY